MKLKSIELKNFRQFIDEKIDFSMDKDKNITLVRGHNSGGKTTLANAITWCLFGKTNFIDNNKSLVNKLVFQNMTNRKTVDVEVILEIVHSGREYRISTKQEFIAQMGISANAKLRLQPNSLLVRNISYKDENGIKQQIDSNKADYVISEIIPTALSDYFFIKAEQMDELVSNLDTSNGKKFKEAVDKVLGFNVIENAIIHMAEALKIFKNRIESEASDKIKKLSSDIKHDKDRQEELKTYIEQCRDIIIQHDDEIKRLDAQIQEGEEGARDLKLLNMAKQNLETYNKYAELNEKNLYKNFSDSLLQYLYAPLLPEIKEKLENTDLSEKDIPDVTSSTIDYILEHKECICGNKIEEGSKEWEILNNLKNYVPPEFIGNAISRFKDAIETREEMLQNSDLNDSYIEFLEKREHYNEKIGEANNTIKTLSDKLKTYESTEDFQKRKELLERNILEKKQEISKYEKEFKKLDSEKGEKQATYNRLIEQDKINATISRRRDYLERIYKNYQDYNMQNRQNLHKLLNLEVNKFFQTAFSDNYKIIIEPNYAIKLVDNDGNFVGAGGAQSISTVFAFITSLLMLSRQIHYGNLKEVFNENGECLLSTETYPLVLDAPFSYFDEKRTSIVAPKLSNLTEQVIIFSKDPECKIIIDNAMDKIGKLYTLEFDTRVENGKEEVWSTHFVEGGTTNVD